MVVALSLAVSALRSPTSAEQEERAYQGELQSEAA